MIAPPPTHAPSRRGRRPKDLPDARAALLAAATSAFARYGFDGADLRGIAAEAGVSANLIRVHFHSKAELWNACIDAISSAANADLERIHALISDSAIPLRTRLEGMIRQVADFYFRHPDVCSFVGRQAADDSERSDRIARSLLEPAYEICKPIIVEAIASGHVRASSPVTYFALMNHALSIHGNFPRTLQRLEPGLSETQARASMVETVIRALVQPQ